MMEKLHMLSADELEKEVEARRRKEVRHLKIRKGYIDLRWNGYGYAIDWVRIDTRNKLLEWIWHLMGKGWMDLYRMELFVEAVCKHWGWNLYDPDA